MKNIFAKLIITTKENLKEEIITKFALEKHKNENNFEIYIKNQQDFSIVLLFVKNLDFKEPINYIKENFDIIKTLNIGFATPFESVDLKFGDIIIPNCLINQENQAIFLENLVDLNYDLNNFGLIMNGICLTYDKKIENEDEILSIKEKFSCDIIDDESFHIGNILKENDLVKDYIVIKGIGEENITGLFSIFEIIL